MSTINIADLDLLEKAHIFEREDGRQSRILFVTNTTLSSKTQKKFPPQVVYADEHNNILSCDIERFLATRKFHNVDPELEQRLNDLLVPSSQLDADKLDLDDNSLVVVGDDEDDGVGIDSALSMMAAEATAVVSRGEEQQADEFENSEPCVTFIPSTLDLPLVFDPAVLAAAVSSYQQSPNLNDNSIQHQLFIAAENGITQEKLYAAFAPSNEEAGINSIFTFSVNIDGKVLDINWDSFAGVYPCVFYGTTMFQAIFVTSVETIAEDNVAAAVAVSAAPVVAADPAPAAAPAPVTITVNTATAAAPTSTATPTPVEVVAAAVAPKVTAQ